ncbi:hypothetical protein [Mesorhizobium sp. P5_C1]
MASFREGWALKSPTATKAHYFRRPGVGLAVSLCGSQDAAAGWLRDPGDVDKCDRCARLLAKEVAKSAAVPPEAGQDERGDHRTCDGKAGD